MLVENYYTLNGVIRPIETFSYVFPNNARIVYEVLRVKNSTPIFFEQHLDRLFHSIKLLNVAQPEKVIIRKMVTDLLLKNPVVENNIRISLVYSTPALFDILIYFTPSSYPTPLQRDNGVILKTLKANRDNPNAKVENSSLREKADKIIKESGCYEVLLVDGNGYITEGSRSNIFLIKDDTLYTPPLDMVLGGITRDAVINISKRLGIQLKEEPIHIDRMDEFDSAIQTGTSPGVLPISMIDSKKFKVSSRTLRVLIDEYNDVVAKDIDNFRKV